MNKELYVSSTPHETRLALLEDGEVAELYFEREKEYSLAGAIYKGRVTRVLPGMQSAFVDVGLERDAFLYVSDFLEDSEEFDRVVSEAENAVEKLTQPSAPAEPARAAAEAAADAAETDEPAAPGLELAGPPPGTGEGEGEGFRRGRRRHRGRRGGTGIPDKKFARPGEHPAEAAGQAPDEATGTRPEPSGRAVPSSEFRPRPDPRGPQGAGALGWEPRGPQGAGASGWEQPESGPGRAAAPQPAAGAQPVYAAAALTLPGESLAKYRRGAPPAPVETWTEAPRPPAAAAAEAAPEPAAAVGGPRPAPTATSSEPAPAPRRPQPEAAPAAAVAGPAAAVAALVLPGESLAKYRNAAPPPAPASEPEPAWEPDASAAVRAATGEARRQAPAPGAESEAAAGAADPDRDGGEDGPERRPRRSRRGRGGERTDATEQPARAPAEGKNESARQIADLLRAGQEILVQIAKEPIGKKGARITSHLALPGRFLVYMPTVHHVGVSRRISSDEERARLKRLIQENSQDLPGGFIVRTAGAGASDEAIKADIRLLANVWADLRQQLDTARAPALLHHDLNLVERTLRDQLSDEFTHIYVDNEEQYQRVVKFVSYFMPHLVERVRLYTRDESLFEHFGIQEEINKALKSQVWLKSGGYIVVNQTEALVAIDVNTGKYVGKSNRLEDTIVKTNVEAIREIVRQIRLRDLGGIIVIDFIDMDERRNRQKVMQAMEEAMRADRAPSKILAFNDFGLVALTRKRVKQSLERTLGSACPYCTGVGLVKSPVTVCNEIYAEVKKLAPAMEREDFVLRVNPEVAKALKEKGGQRLLEMEELTRKAVSVRPDPQVHQERFEIY